MEKYTQKRLKNQRLVELILSSISQSSQERVKMCGTFLQFLADSSLEKKKLHKGFFCENRFCPMCSWRQARRDAMKIGVLMKFLTTHHKKEFIFLTLTAPNVKADKLREEIKKYNQAFAKLTKRKEIIPIIQGYIRKLEVTYNKERNDYHPHLHILIAVNKSYFTSRDYLKQSEWLRIWQEVMKDDTITQVHVEKVGKKNNSSAINEVSKYVAKDSEYLMSQEIFDTFYKSLKGLQMLVYSGLFSEANKLYKDGELNAYKEIDETEYVYMLLYKWGLGEYVETEKRELTEQERRDFNKHLLEEQEVD